MAKVSQVAGLAREREDFGDEKTYAMWEVFGNPLLIRRSLFEKEGSYNGNPTFSVLCECEWENPDTGENETIKVWVGGQISRDVAAYFKTHVPGTITDDPLEGTIWLSPTVGATQYNGWCMLDSDVTPDDYTMPPKAAQKLMDDKRASKTGSKEMSFEPSK